MTNRLPLTDETGEVRQLTQCYGRSPPSTYKVRSCLSQPVKLNGTVIPPAAGTRRSYFNTAILLIMIRMN
jgi:hypothetical protein